MISYLYCIGLPWWLRRWSGSLQCRRPGFDPWVGKTSWRRKWKPTPVLLPGKPHGWRSLVGYSPWGHRQSDTAEWLHFHFHCMLTLTSEPFPFVSFLFLVVAFPPKKVNIHCKGSLVILTPFSFSLSVKLLISPSNMKENILTWQKRSHDHEGIFLRTRLIHCTLNVLILAISTNVGNLTV